MSAPIAPPSPPATGAAAPLAPPLPPAAGVPQGDGTVRTRLALAKTEAAAARADDAASAGAGGVAGEPVRMSEKSAVRLPEAWNALDVRGGASTGAAGAFAMTFGPGADPGASLTEPFAGSGTGGSGAQAVGALPLPVLFASRGDAPPTSLPIVPGSVPLDGASGHAADELAGGVRWTLGQGRGHALLNVTPAGLGPVAIRVSLDGDEISVSIAASHAGAREALESLVPRLREQLAADGHASVQVDVSGGSDPRAGAGAGDRAPQERSGTGRAGDGAHGDAAASGAHAAEVVRGPASGRSLVDAWA